MRKGLFVLAMVLAALLAGAPAEACESCFGAKTDSPLIDGAKTGMILLLGVTLSVQGGFVAFFLHLRRRAKRYAQAQLEAEWDELQRRDSKS